MSKTNASRSNLLKRLSLTEGMSLPQSHYAILEFTFESIFSFFDGDRIISLWPGLSASPILTDYFWSPLVQSAVSRNFAVLQPASAKLLYSLNSTLSGLVAVHLRRGDYKRHCPRLAGWASTYNGLNQYPSLPDRFNPTPYKDDREAHDAYYMRHCLPTVEQIVERLRIVRAENPGLRRVYVLTNAWGWWLNGLKSALQKDGWEDLKSSLDIQLDAAQIHVAMAVDMAIAEKAEIFVGNGVSVHLMVYIFACLMCSFVLPVLKFNLQYRDAPDGEGAENLVKQVLVIFCCCISISVISRHNISGFLLHGI